MQGLAMYIWTLLASILSTLVLELPLLLLKDAVVAIHDTLFL